jgi:hypothetical protein
MPVGPGRPTGVGLGVHLSLRVANLGRGHEAVLIAVQSLKLRHGTAGGCPLVEADLAVPVSVQLAEPVGRCGGRGCGRSHRLEAGRHVVRGNGSVGRHVETDFGRPRRDGQAPGRRRLADFPCCVFHVGTRRHLPADRAARRRGVRGRFRGGSAAAATAGAAAAGGGAAAADSDSRITMRRKGAAPVSRRPVRAPSASRSAEVSPVGCAAERGRSRANPSAIATAAIAAKTLPFIGADLRRQPYPPRAASSTDAAANGKGRRSPRLSATGRRRSGHAIPSDAGTCRGRCRGRV